MYYEKYCANIISDMTQVVVAVGLVTVLADYVRSGLTDPGLLDQPAFWLRWVLLLITILFTSYHLLAYSADMASHAGDTGWGREEHGPSQIIALFFLDLAGLGAMGAMYGALYVDVDFGRNPFAIDWIGMAWLAAMAGAYHFLMVLWHATAGSRWTAPATHALYLLLFTGLATWALQDEHQLAGLAPVRLKELWTGVFALVVLSLYFTRGRRIIRDTLLELR